MKKLKMKKRLISYPMEWDKDIVRCSRLRRESANSFIALAIDEFVMEALTNEAKAAIKQNKQRALQKK